MEKRLSWGLAAFELGTAMAALAYTFIVNPGLSKLQSTLGTLNNSPVYFVAYFGLIFLSIILAAYSGKHFQILYSKKKLSSKDKKLGLGLAVVCWVLIIYLYGLPLLDIVNSI